MKESRRAKRMQRHHDRSGDKNASLNMVSLMDIFTILVFFLLVSAANSDILPTPKNIKLPRSTAEKMPKENLVIMVGDNKILLQGKKISDISSVIKSEKLMVMPLYNALRTHTLNPKKKSKAPGKNKGVTIMGDREIPYVLLKKIMLTCSGAKYTDISLAVNRKKTDKG
jgi:biopolymer transport protein TolR